MIVKIQRKTKQLIVYRETDKKRIFEQVYMKLCMDNFYEMRYRIMKRKQNKINIYKVLTYLMKNM